MSPIIVWFRQDFRLADNPALFAAAATGAPLIPVYIVDDDLGGAHQVWLHHALDALMEEVPLRLFEGDPLEVLTEIMESTGAEALYFNRRYEPKEVKLERRLSNAFPVESFNGSLLIEPWEITNKQGTPFLVFTPYWKTALRHLDEVETLQRPRKLNWAKKGPKANWKPTKDPKWAGTITDYWTISEAGAHQRLKAFVSKHLNDYGTLRDRPDHDATSRLSPYLHWGHLSPRQVWIKAASHKRSEPFLRELGWREFCYHLLFHFPTLPTNAFRPEFDKFPWKWRGKGVDAWQKGMTGYPIVDAGMRQLWATGWMHNRVRMIVASFLTKDLLIHWKVGERWFWDTLVDGDLASNVAGWQWTAGCGADAAPYFRVFNPTTQGEKFDPDGAYIRKWIPELKNVPADKIHTPWEVPALCPDYPPPIVDHSEAREAALAAYNTIKK